MPGVFNRDDMFALSMLVSINAGLRRRSLSVIMKKTNAIRGVILFSLLCFFALPVHSQDDPPPKPTGLTAKAGDGQATLSWDTPPSTAQIDSWEYGFKLAGGASYTWDSIPGSSSSTTSYIVSGLTNGST